MENYALKITTLSPRGNELIIHFVTQVKEAKPKSYKNVYARDPDAEIQRARTFHLNDEEETEIEQSDTVEGTTLYSYSVVFPS